MVDIKNKVRPNFLIVGASKAGTTSLYHLINQHPDAFLSRNKEPSYFVHGFGLSDLEKYLSLFELGRGKKAIGEASTAYLASPESPYLILKELRDVKIIIILRNPVDRAFSLYSWMSMWGCEWLPTFEMALNAEERRFSDQWFRWENPEYFWDYMYFRSGLYYEQVKRYMDNFNKEYIKIYLFEDLTNNPLQFYRDVCNFLCISDNFHPVSSKENSSKLPRFNKLQYLLWEIQRLSLLHHDSFPYIPMRWVRLAKEINLRLGPSKKFSNELRERLKTAYSEDIMKLSKLIKQDLSHWLLSRS